MLDIYLTDVQKNVQFNDYPGEHPVKFVLNFKKIFPSVMELLLPVLPENENLEEMTWESTTADFELFKLLLSGWGVIELRLNAIKQFKDKDFADTLVKRAQQKRKDFAKAQIEAGCDVIGIGDAICSQIDPFTYDAFVKELPELFIL